MGFLPFFLFTCQQNSCSYFLGRRVRRSCLCFRHERLQIGHNFVEHPRSHILKWLCLVKVSFDFRCASSFQFNLHLYSLFDVSPRFAVRDIPRLTKIFRILNTALSLLLLFANFIASLVREHTLKVTTPVLTASQLHRAPITTWCVCINIRVTIIITLVALEFNITRLH